MLSSASPSATTRAAGILFGLVEERSGANPLSFSAALTRPSVDGLLLGPEQLVRPNTLSLPLEWRSIKLITAVSATLMAL